MKILNRFLLVTWIWNLFFWAFALPPFFIPDEAVHWTWVSRFVSNSPQTHPVSECSELEKTVHAFEFKKVFADTEGFVPRDGPLPIDQVPLSKCQEIKPPGAYAFLGLYMPAAFSFYMFEDWGRIALFTKLLNALTLSLLLFVLWRKIGTTQSKHFLPTFWAFALIGNFPITLQQSVGLSMDFWTLAGSLGIFGVCFFSLFNRLEFSLFSFSILMAGLSKPVFLPLLGLILVLNKKDLLRTQKGRLVTWGCALSLSAIAIRGLIYFASSHFLGNSGSLMGAGPEKLMNPSVEFILKNPWQAFVTVATGSWGKIAQLPGTRLGALSWPLSKTHTLLGHLSLILFLACLNWRNFKSILSRLIPATGFLFIFVFLTGLSLYLGHTAPGANSVAGLQARYFIPFWFGLFLILSSMGFMLNAKKLKMILAVITVCLFTNATITATQIFLAFR